MSTEQTETPQWGAPPPPAQPRTRWSVKRIAVAVAIAVGIAAAGGVAIYAASGSTAAEQGGPGGGRTGGPMLVGGPMGGMSGIDHGEFLTGEITELTDDSITAASEDGYTRTYVIDDGTELTDGIEKGDEVTIVATTDGDIATAESVMEMGTMPQRRAGGGPPQNGDRGQDGGN
ncbi:hypothetical protein [Actinophytocola glycyrrhizae]|uniref:DUF5666 domain-containing protein n=1 Tax=Actinophytocola glycyrrhizae TaxID=2044873 RepID=A0ABV9RXQ6_9PSEU